ncbi:hypothetical protein FZ103_20495 [Streptomonospora sp. PA3]|uniref:septum formation family protein n=1 Tax=Streptomonospora sp. PA3 TaxID=2607326 RepID=UPI0012DC5D94|nr:septum formation family protein [Streptomonospora sp. PA3]MUL43520.1 hypothetical protein [Streptomonospora sp. PA3]
MPSTTILLRAAAACAAGLTLTGCGVLPAPNPVQAMDVGDCLVGAMSLRRAVPVDCDEPHLGEVLAHVALEDGAYPGEDALLERAMRECPGRFEDYVGLDHLRSVFDLRMALPIRWQWTLLNDRRITCVAVDHEGDLTGSVADARI